MISHIDLLRKPDPTNKSFLKWNDFENQILTGFSQLFISKSLADVTLLCDGTSIKAHKLVLSMYSPYLRMILTEAHGKHPVITIDGVKAKDLINVLEFLYLGKVCVLHEDIENFVETARFLNIDGIYGERSDLQHVRDSASSSQSEVPAHWARDVPLNMRSRPSWPIFGEKKGGVHPPVPIPPPLPPPLPAPTHGHSENRTYPPNLPMKQSILPPTDPKEHMMYPVPSNYRGQYGAFHPFSSRKFNVDSPNFPGLGAPIIRELSPSARSSDGVNDEPIDMHIKPDVKHNRENEPSKSSEPTPTLQQQQQQQQKNFELFTTPSGMVVSTAYAKRHGPPLPGSTNPTVTARYFHMTGLPEVPTRSMNLALPPPPGPVCLSSKAFVKDRVDAFPAPEPLHRTTIAPHYNKSIKYTPSQVRALVQSVDGLAGPFVPCKICQKVVKRERLRTHIYECHLVNGEKITCQYCGVALKSKGSYRVHVWRHRNGNLKKNKSKGKYTPP